MSINGVNGPNGISQADLKQLLNNSEAKVSKQGGDNVFAKYESDDDNVTVEVKGEFKSAKDLEKSGKTKHWIAAHDGPDKGSHYYSDKDYDKFGYYKANKNK